MFCKRIGSFVLAIASMCLWPGLGVAQDERLQEPAVQQPGDTQMRQRPGGHPLGEAEALRDEQQATAKGVPEAGEAPQGRPEVLEQGEVRPRFLRRPPWRLGVYAYNTPTGVVVTRVMPATPADRLGFEPGDRIVAVSGYQVGIVGGRVYYLGEELQRRVDPRGRVELLVQNVRNNQLLNMDARLASPRFGGEPAAALEREAEPDGRGDRELRLEAESGADGDPRQPRLNAGGERDRDRPD